MPTVPRTLKQEFPLQYPAGAPYLRGSETPCSSPVSVSCATCRTHSYIAWRTCAVTVPVNVCVSVCTRALPRKHTHTHTHAHTHTRIHTRTHTHAQAHARAHMHTQRAHAPTNARTHTLTPARRAGCTPHSPSARARGRARAATRASPRPSRWALQRVHYAARPPARRRAGRESIKSPPAIRRRGAAFRL